MRTLVVGGSRFAGLHLVHRLVHQQHQVTVLNRGNHNDALPAEVRVLRADRQSRDEVLEVLQGHDFDAVFDEIGYVPGDLDPFIDYFQGRIHHYVFISTGSVYEPTRIAPLHEDFPRVEDDTYGAYGYKKRLLEDQLLEAYVRRNFPTTIIRPGYIYGPHNYAYRERFFFDRALLGRPILVPGSGMAMSQFGHASDLARMQELVLGKPAAIGRAYNFVGEYAYTMDHYVELITEVVNRPVDVVHFDPDALGLDDAVVGKVFPFNWRSHKVRSMARARYELGYREQFSLLEGLKTAFDQYTRDGLRQLEPDFAAEDSILAAL